VGLLIEFELEQRSWICERGIFRNILMKLLLCKFEINYQALSYNMVREYNITWTKKRSYVRIYTAHKFHGLQIKSA